MGKDTVLVLAELSQAGGTWTLRQMVLTNWIHALLGEVHGALGTQRRAALNPVQGMWLGRAFGGNSTLSSLFVVCLF